jgi:putative nucleotidyltransferase with HDIG domain
LAQTVEVFCTTYGVDAAYDMAAARRGSWFDPQVVDALLAMRSDDAFWRSLSADDPIASLSAFEPNDRIVGANEDRLDRVAEAFALVIDAKSPWTHQHSRGVADLTVAIAKTMGYAADQLRDARRAALLHDIGKLGVSSLILDKPGRLTDEEFTAVRKHPADTREILKRTGCFSHLANLAAAHHERLDGSGYNLGLSKSALSLISRVLCTADICDALRASRPYRPGLPTERVLGIMRRDVGTAIDPICFEALESVLQREEIAQRGDVPAARHVPALSEDYRQAA